MSTPGQSDADAPGRAQEAEALREAMITELREMGAVRSDRVAEVFRAVPRHLFTPEVSLGAAYDPRDAVRVKRDEQGVTISTVSSPQLQSGMLEQVPCARSPLSIRSVGRRTALAGSAPAPTSAHTPSRSTAPARQPGWPPTPATGPHATSAPPATQTPPTTSERRALRARP
ncbi:MAG: hypothetical protein ACRDRZ_07150 [Pseudonocardiaceae bacterium]